MLSLRGIAARAWLVRPYWDGRDVRIASATSTPTTSTSTPTAGTSRCSRAGLRCAGTSSLCNRSEPGEPLEPGAHDLLYIGGGQDREQALIAPDLAAKSAAIRHAVAEGAAAARGLRRLPAARTRATAGATARGCRAPASSPRDRRRDDADDRRRAARVRARARCLAGSLPGSRTTPGAPCSIADAEPLGRVVSRLRERRRVGFRGLSRWGERSARICTGRCCRGTPGSPTGSRTGSRPCPGRRSTDSGAASGRARGGGVSRRRGAGARPRWPPLRAIFRRGTPAHHPLRA